MTPYSGLPKEIASAFAAETPTSSAPARPGPGRDRERVYIGQDDAGVGAGPLDRRHHRFEVSATGDLGHDPAEARMLIDTRRHGVGEQSGAAYDADSCLVAGGLDPQHQGFVSHRDASLRCLRRRQQQPPHHDRIDVSGVVAISARNLVKASCPDRD